MLTVPHTRTTSVITRTAAGLPVTSNDDVGAVAAGPLVDEAPEVVVGPDHVEAAACEASRCGTD